MNKIQLLMEQMFVHQIQLKMFHFQTEKYGAHKASDAYLEKFLNNFDKFFEVAQGIYGRVTNKQMTLNIMMSTDGTIRDDLDKFILILTQLDAVVAKHSDLLNIRDEMVADLNQLKYLLTFV